jgi:hypothetical protein
MRAKGEKDMDDILSQLSASLGTHPGQTEVGAGALLNLIREHASQGDFDQLLKAVPEAAQWMGTAANAAGGGAAPGGVPGASPAGGGLFGEILGEIGTLSGGAGGIGGLIAALAHSGLSPDKLSQLVPTLLTLLEQRAGTELLQRLAESFPILKSFTGAGGVGASADGTTAASPAAGILGDLGKMFG